MSASTMSDFTPVGVGWVTGQFFPALYIKYSMYDINFKEEIQYGGEKEK